MATHLGEFTKFNVAQVSNWSKVPCSREQQQQNWAPLGIEPGTFQSPGQCSNRRTVAAPIVSIIMLPIYSTFRSHYYNWYMTKLLYSSGVDPGGCAPPEATGSLFFKVTKCKIPIQYSCDIAKYKVCGRSYPVNIDIIPEVW